MLPSLAATVTEIETISRHRFRKIDLNLTTRKKGERTIKASLSSEYHFERHDGFEILEHTPNAFDLSRTPPLLIMTHNGNKLNVGLVEGLKVVGRKLRGSLRFGERKEAYKF